MDLILQGLFWGGAISLLVGPIFFGLIQISVEKSVKAAIIYASGIWISDIVYVLIIEQGLGYISDDIQFRMTFGIIGAILLVAFGVGIFFSPLKKQTITTVGIKSGIGYFFKGVAINVFNPFVFILWISILSNISSVPIGKHWHFIGPLLLVVAITDVLKAYYANKLGKLLNEKNLILVKKVSGMLLGMFGIVLLIRTLIHL